MMLLIMKIFQNQTPERLSCTENMKMSIFMEVKVMYVNVQDTLKSKRVITLKH